MGEDTVVYHCELDPLVLQVLWPFWFEDDEETEETDEYVEPHPGPFPVLSVALPNPCGTYVWDVDEAAAETAETVRLHERIADATEEEEFGGKAFLSAGDFQLGDVFATPNGVYRISTVHPSGRWTAKLLQDTLPDSVRELLT